MVRFVTLGTGAISQILSIAIVNKLFGPQGVVLATTLPLLLSVYALLEFGKFASVVNLLNSGEDISKLRGQIFGIYVDVARNLFFYMILISTLMCFFHNEFSNIIIVLICFSQCINAIAIFVLKTYLAMSRYKTFYTLTALQHFINPAIILLASRYIPNLETVLFLGLFFSVIVNVSSAFFFILKNRLIASLVKIESSKNSARYFSYIAFELGLFYQWDRLWITQANLNNSKEAIYCVSVLALSSLMSILAIDYQEIWNQHARKEKINYTKVVKVTLVQGFSLSMLVFCFLSIYLDYLTSETTISLSFGLLIALTLVAQSFHNINAGICSVKEEDLRYQANLIFYCVVMRLALFTLLGLTSTLNVIFIYLTWLLPFLLLQIPFTYLRAKRNLGDA